MMRIMMASEAVRQKEKTKRLFIRSIKKNLAKPEQLTVSQWAEKYRILTDASSVPGKWSNDITPYLVEIMDSFNDPYIKRINFCKPTQVGGTEAAINIMGWIVAQNPSPTMFVYPSDDLAKEVSTEKLRPAIRKTPALMERFQELRSKELKLKFRGMTLYLSGSGSPKKLASKAIKYLIFDEIDKMEGASKKEASPYNLALERTKTYQYSKKIYTCSTPTLKTNYVWNLHETAEEKRHYFVPCPHCGEYIELLFGQVRFDEGKGMDLAKRAKTAKYICQECGCIIKNRDKPSMLKAGEWRAVELIDAKWKVVERKQKIESVSFWLNSLYSVFVNWEDAAKEFLESYEDPDKLQNFANSWLAEPWEDTKLKTSAELVLERQTEYEELIVPSWAKLLCGGVDVQENCLYWTIRAFGNFLTSQNIAHGQALNFSEVERIMNLEYTMPDGTPQVVNLALIDSGDQTDDVYDFCAANEEWAIPCKGASHRIQSHYKFSTVNKVNSSAYGMDLVIVDGDKYKDMIASRMRRENGRGSWMVYKGCDQEYAKQVTAEHKINEKNGGRISTKWVPKKSHADNHYLDCEVYCMAAADIMGARTLGLKDTRDGKEKKTSQQHEPQDPPLNNSEESWIKNNEDWL